MMHILLIEDEIPAFDKLKLHLSQYFKDAFTYCWTRSVEETIGLLSEDVHFDLIISDIKLLDGTAFDIFEKKSLTIPIVFCTAYDSFLLKAFQSNGIAYLLKPYKGEEIDAVLKKYESLFPTSRQIDTSTFRSLKEVLSGKVGCKKRFVIKTKKGIHLLESADIAVVEAEGDFCKLIDKNGKTHLYSQSIGKIYASLNPDSFFRINRSQLVQLSFITQIENHFKNRLLLTVVGRSDKLKTSSSTTAAFRIWLDK